MVAGKPKWKSWFTRQNDGIMSRLRARLTLTTKRSIRGNKMTTSTSGKRKQKKGSAPTGDSQPAAGGELHQIAAGEHPALTTNQGLAISDNQNSLRSNPRGLRCWRISSCAKKSPISITSVFPNVSYTRVRPVRMGTSS